MKTTFIYLAYFLICFNINSQEKGNKVIEAEMKEAFDTYTDGKTFQDWEQGAKMMIIIGKNNPDEWLPDFWAAYFYTQLVNNIPKTSPPDGVTKQTLLDKSQESLDKALKKAPKLSNEIRSDIHVLQTLIFDFRSWNTIKKDEIANFKVKRTIEIKKAAKLNSNSPLVDVLIGTDLIKTRDFASVFAGRVLLLHAQNKFNQRLGPRYMSSHFNEQWVSFWLRQSKLGIRALTTTEKNID